jgi:TetR/AcrR family transcriptional regulator, regulator of autoinduction and epiphytic fitness
MARKSFREQVVQAREAAIVQAVNRLLAERGFDAMTVNAVADEVGIAKASLYKHFRSKEELAAAAMIRVLDQGLAHVEEIVAHSSGGPLERLKAVVRWALERQLAGEMPTLPMQNSALRATLGANPAYLDRMVRLSESLGGWITEAQAAGRLAPALAPEVVLYTLFARACDPVLPVLRATGRWSDERIVETVIATCFDGLCGAVTVAGAAVQTSKSLQPA